VTGLAVLLVDFFADRRCILRTRMCRHQQQSDHQQLAH
jgi:hypothetical protein